MKAAAYLTQGSCLSKRCMPYVVLRKVEITIAEKLGYSCPTCGVPTATTSPRAVSVAFVR